MNLGICATLVQLSFDNLVNLRTEFFCNETNFTRIHGKGKVFKKLKLRSCRNTRNLPTVQLKYSNTDRIHFPWRKFSHQIWKNYSGQLSTEFVQMGDPFHYQRIKSKKRLLCLIHKFLEKKQEKVMIHSLLCQIQMNKLQSGVKNDQSKENLSLDLCEQDRDLISYKLF